MDGHARFRTAPAQPHPPHDGPARFVFRCPACGQPLTERPDGLWCPANGHEYPEVDGIYRFLSPEDLAAAGPNVEATVGTPAAQGWGAPDPTYYLNLPWMDVSGHHSEVWQRRAESLKALAQALRTRPRGLALDLGAGTCWLTRHLTEWGFKTPLAIDLNDDPRDGLGAGAIYLKRLRLRFQRAQARLEELPLRDGQAALVVLSAVLHLVPDRERVLAEAARLLAPGGLLVVNDSPTVSASGSDTAGRLTYEEMAWLETAVGLRWQARQPGAGLGGRLKRWLAPGRPPAGEVAYPLFVGVHA